MTDRTQTAWPAVLGVASGLLIFAIVVAAFIVAARHHEALARAACAS